MSQYTFHTVESAPETARPILQKAKETLGFVPSLYAGLANSPAALQAYLALSDFFDKTSFSPIERQVVLLVVSAENGCEYCVAAHSFIAKKMAGVPDAVVSALRERRAPEDSKLAALASYTRVMVSERGWVADHPALQAFLSAGYSQQQALEVVVGVAQKTLSNYANHLLKTPLDAAFGSERWTR
ncbi:MAG: carboxymuconolactone decarboxylase family protein [Steroidobacteraceae bacterium]